jgi:hypothetical protein
VKGSGEILRFAQNDGVAFPSNLFSVKVVTLRALFPKGLWAGFCERL